MGDNSARVFVPGLAGQPATHCSATQVLGKLAAGLAPPQPVQHAALRLTARGWETAPLPAPDGSGAVAVVLDLRVPEGRSSSTAAAGPSASPLTRTGRSVR
jgi:hypothetical protein